MTDPHATPEEPEWVPVVSMGSSAELREVLELLIAAKIPARPLAQPAMGTYAVLVPEPEVEVAMGVVDHFLIEHEGDADHAEIVAELEEHARSVDPEERALRLAEAERRARLQMRLIALLMVLGFLGYVLALAL